MATRPSDTTPVVTPEVVEPEAEAPVAEPPPVAAAEERVLLTVEAHPIIGRTARYRVGTNDDGSARIIEEITPPVAAP